MHLGKNKILITGANGFLGYEILKFLSKKNKVIGTSRIKNNSYIHINYPKIRIKERHLNGVNTVFHLASLDRDQVKKNIKYSNVINLSFTEELIDMCIKKKVKNFIYFSSVGVYGDNLKNSVDESTKPKPKDIYSKLKYSVEKKILKKKKIKVVVLRLSNVIGKPSRVSKGFLKLFLPDICNSALASKKIILKSDGKQYRDFIDLKLLLNIVSKVLLNVKKINKNTIFNVSSGNPVQIIQASYKVQNIMKTKFKKKISIIKGKKTKEKKYKISNNKLKNFIKLKIFFDLEKTIFDVIKFLKKNEIKTS